MLQPRTLIALDDSDSLNAPILHPGLLRWTGAARNSGSESCFCVINAQSFQPGKPFLIGGPTGNVLSPPDFVPFLLQSVEQIFLIRAGGKQPVNGDFQLCFIAGAIPYGLMLSVALALLLPGNDNGQAMLFAEQVRGTANLIVTALVGMVMLVIREAGANAWIKCRPRFSPLSMACRLVQANSMSAVSAEQP